MATHLLSAVQVKEILQEEEDLSEIVQLVGKVSFLCTLIGDLCTLHGDLCTLIGDP